MGPRVGQGLPQYLPLSQKRAKLRQQVTGRQEQGRAMKQNADVSGLTESPSEQGDHSSQPHPFF